MGQYYNPKKSARYLFNPASKEPYKISRSKIDLFKECPRCFYLDQRLGVGRPPSFPFTLNNAVDYLMKKEFDIHRAEGTAHPLAKAYGIDAVPFQHEKIEEWRDALRRGVSCLHKKTNLIVRGGIDDVWVNPQGELIIVDYKATSKDGEVSLDADWQDSYKRQMEVYQWLFRENDFKVSDTGYFVYANGITDKEAFDGKLEFDITIIPYTGSDKWIDKTLEEIKETLMSEKLPPKGEECNYCQYRETAGKILLEKHLEEKKAQKTELESGKLF
jgi:CRISPR/Cas system-associated exonuclease Cas4 (RecB family)